MHRKVPSALATSGIAQGNIRATRANCRRKRGQLERMRNDLERRLNFPETEERQVQEDADYGAVDSVRVLARLYGGRSEGQRASGRAFRRTTHNEACLRVGDKSVRKPAEMHSDPRGRTMIKNIESA